MEVKSMARHTGPSTGTSTGPWAGPWAGIVGTVALLGIPAIASATPSAPTGLAAGSNYRLVFITANTTPATSANIATYNALVMAEATAAGLTGTYKAIASTATVNAIDNIACTPSCAADPIFLVTGAEVAASTADLFDGAIMTTVNTTANGATAPFFSYVWTGSVASGVRQAGNALGSAVPALGLIFLTDGSWINVGIDNDTNSYNLYAISDELKVAGATPAPEPVSMSLLLIGLAGTAAARHRARRRA